MSGHLHHKKSKIFIYLLGTVQKSWFQPEKAEKYALYIESMLIYILGP